jgi:7-cyano-7-deazaguanine synthase
VRLLLLSGGLDSAALAAWLEPERALTIDYGQRCAGGEIEASRQVSKALGITWDVLEIDCRQIGSGLLAGTTESSFAPDEEWWPYRNQLLVSFAAAWGLARGVTEILLGCVSDDSVHADGRAPFIAAADALLAQQEGGIRVSAPAQAMTSAALLAQSGIRPGLLAWTHSCNRATTACGTCRSCVRREATLREYRR